jgi:hypothetical protein
MKIRFPRPFCGVGRLLDFVAVAVFPTSGGMIYQRQYFLTWRPEEFSRRRRKISETAEKLLGAYLP